MLFPNPERLLPHQLTTLKDLHRFKVLIWHRRARKTTTSIIELTRQALYKQGVYWHVFPTYGEAKDAVWRAPDMLFNIIPKEFIKKKNEADLVLELINGSILQLKGADNPERLLGAGPKGVVLDEFEEMKFETWQRVIEPILRANNGWCWFIGTPKGKNHLYQFYNLGQREDSEWKSWMLKASESGIIAKDQLENSRQTMTEALFRQEWECEFLEGEGSVFRNVRRACTSKPQTALSDHLYVMGVDLAKVVDYTVVTVYDRNGNNQVYQEKFARLEWPFQKKKIKAISDSYNKALVYLDATGVGDPIADDLLREGVPVEPVKITETIKKELIEKLSIWIEQQKLHMLYLTETLEEFDNFSYELGPTGRVRYGAREGFHDDIVLSHSLACYGLQPVIKEPEPEEIKPLHEYYKQLKQGGYETEELIDDTEF